jgi:Fic family protein
MNTELYMNEGNERISPEQIDLMYRKFPCFSEFAELRIDDERWKNVLDNLSASNDVSAEIMQRARNVATRAAAVDTGAIENLYDVSAGFTISVATEVGAWEAAFSDENRRRGFIESQLEAYNYVLDFATGRAPIAAKWIRELHVILCKPQGTFLVTTAAGEQQHELPLGKYKTSPNHVKTRSGKFHAYAPVLDVEQEMQRLITELSSKLFQDAHPIIQAAYSHYAFVLIHPFSDGNGRVSRALASVFLYRAISLPLMILVENRDFYFAVLEQADAESYQPLVDFVQLRTVDAANLVAESIRTARTPDPEIALAEISRLYKTSGGYLHSAIDGAGTAVLNEIESIVMGRLKEMLTPMSAAFSLTRQGDYQTAPPGSRPLINRQSGNSTLSVVMPAPAAANYSTFLYVWVPFDPAESDPIRVGTSLASTIFEIPISQVIPRLTTVSSFKISMFAEGIVGLITQQLNEQGKSSLISQGFLPNPNSPS